RYWRNLGRGHFAAPRPMASAPAGLSFADRGVMLLDADGNGRADLLVMTPEQAGYFPLRFDGQWDRRSFTPFSVTPSIDLEDPETRLVDLDGDGVTDVIRSGTRLECFFNDRDRHKAWSETRSIERHGLDDFPNVSFSDPRVRWADMTGDGLQDIVLMYDGNVQYWPALGRGDWAKPVLMRNGPNIRDAVADYELGYDPRRLLLGDVDGDGAADLVY